MRESARDAVPWLSNRRSVLLVLFAVVFIGFLTAGAASYKVFVGSLRDKLIDIELPLTSELIYSEIQQDLLKPIVLSSVMAHDTFLRDWIVEGERDGNKLINYLKKIEDTYDIESSFFVSAKTNAYFSANGFIKHVREDSFRDRWFFRVRDMKEAYELNFDPDFANGDKLTVFINYRLLDDDGSFLGAIGLGRSVEAISRLIGEYQSRFGRHVYFVGGDGKIIFHGDQFDTDDLDIRKRMGFETVADAVLKDKSTGNFMADVDGQVRFLNVRFIEELGWYLFVEQLEEPFFPALGDLLLSNLVIFVVISGLVLTVVGVSVTYYQRTVERMANTDRLTGIANRHACEVLLTQTVMGAVRDGRPFSVLIFDIDHFKSVNDTYGHLAGDEVIAEVASRARAATRGSDTIFRWGGEEFLALLRECTLEDAYMVGEKIRDAMLQHPIMFATTPITVAVSVGVAQYRDDDTVDTLLARADTALYTAKTEGRNRTVTEKPVKIAAFLPA